LSQLNPLVLCFASPFENRPRHLASSTIAMTKPHLPETTARVRVTQYSWQSGKIAGEVNAAEFIWEFQWCFRQDELIVEPALGRALIQDALGRFLKKWDYQLEAGGDYEFTVRAKF
jgi:hypothetical protein